MCVHCMSARQDNSGDGGGGGDTSTQSKYTVSMYYEPLNSRCKMIPLICYSSQCVHNFEPLFQKAKFWTTLAIDRLYSPKYMITMWFWTTKMRFLISIVPNCVLKGSFVLCVLCTQDNCVYRKMSSCLPNAFNSILQSPTHS